MSDTNIYDMADAWNNAANIFTAIKMNVTDTASQAGSLLMDLQVGGVSKFSVRKDGFVTGSTGAFSSFVDVSGQLTVVGNIVRWGSGGANGIITGDASNTLAQRNGTNAQAFRVYNTYTDGSNYERGTVQWNSNVFEVGSEAAGTGTARAIRLKAAGVNSLLLNTNALDRWSVTGAGHFIAQLDNTYDIGASGANRPRNIYAAGGVICNVAALGTTATANALVNIGAATTANAHILFAAGVAPTSPVDGQFWFDGTAFKARVGGVTKTFTLT